MKTVVACLFIWTFVQVSLCSTNVVLQNNQLFVNGVEFFIKGVDYNPVPLGQDPMEPDGYCDPDCGGFCSAKLTPWNEWKSACYDSDFFFGGPDIYNTWPSDGFATVWRRDFPLMKAMGANTLRLYNANPTTLQMSELYPASFIPIPNGKNHVPFLDMAYANGFYVIFPLFSDMNAFNTDSESVFKRLLRAQIDEVGNHPAVLFWQFGNEMNWDGDTSVLGFYPYPDLMNKYNMYAEYIRQYTLAKWGRKIPITHAVIDFDTTFDWLLQYFDTDIFSLNTFRGTSTTTLFPGDSNTKGFTYGTCAWNKPLLITEFGWGGYSAGWSSQLISDFCTHLHQGLIGAIIFEHNDEPEPQKAGGQQYMGTVSVSVNTTNGQSSTEENVFIADVVTPKQLYYDLQSGTFNGIAYNYHSDFYALAGTAAQAISSSVDYCSSNNNGQVFVNCPGGYPMCSGHGICNRVAGACACQPGWVGADCATPTCSCSGHGQCSILTSPPQCVCDTGYYGTNCENTLLPSTSCPNNCTDWANGICSAATNYLCQCVSGWTGADCSVVALTSPFPGLGVTQILFPENPPSTPLCVGPISENQVLSISCPSGVISSVQFASFGLPTGTCGSYAHNSACDASDSVSVFETKCLNLNSCSFTVNDATFGDPCVGTAKQFVAQYTCSSVATTECVGPIGESQVLSLTCPSPSQVISSVQFASYGTATGSCGSFAKGSCDASTSVSVFDSYCLNKNSCSFTVGNGAFSDPCEGTIKHFYAQVTCS